MVRSRWGWYVCGVRGVIGVGEGGLGEEGRGGGGGAGGGVETP